MSGHRFAFQQQASGSGSARGVDLYSGLGADDAPVPSTSTAPATTADISNDTESGDKPEEKSKGPSAALHFAPIRKRPAPKAKPTASALSSAFIVASAAPSLVSDAPPAAVEEFDGEVIKEPSMKLDAPKRAPLGEQRMPGGNNKKRKKRKRQNEPADPSKAFAGEYDPSRPNDYHEYKAFLTYKRQQSIREARQAADRIAAGLNSDEDGDSYESDQDEERERVRGKARFFAPPPSYNDDDAPPPAPTGPAPAQTAEEAYARRVAMSQSRQMAPPVVPPPSLPDDDGLRAAAFATMPSSSSQQTIVDSSPAFVRSSAPTPANVPRSVRGAPSSSEYDIATTPTTSADASTMPFPSFRPAPPPQPAFDTSLDALVPDDSPPGSPQPVDATVSAPSFNLSEAQAKARAIAERLAKMAAPPAAPPSMPVPPPGFVMPPPPPGFPGYSSFAPAHQFPDPPLQPQPSHRPDPHGFAKRLMEKHGWKKGQGLGANETGILNPLTVEQAKKQAEQGGLRGATIKSDTRAIKDASDRALYGVESRIVLLRNVCAREEVDEELPTEIAEEAAKCGSVERVKVHVAPQVSATPVEPIDQVRIFVIFTGLVGAYEGVRLFNGRVFNGRTVRAQYFDEGFAQRQAWAIPVDL